jgi:hypothetical protein
MLVTLGIQTCYFSQDGGLGPFKCTTPVTNKGLQTTAVHCLKPICLESGLLLEFIMSATILEQPMKGPVSIYTVSIKHVDKEDASYQ